jgi:MFS family permease
VAILGKPVRMPKFIVSITSLLVGTFLFLIGHGLAGTLLTLRAAEENYSDLMIGIMMASYYGGYVIGTFIGPSLINRIGHIRLFSASAAIAGTIIIVHGLILSDWVWTVLRLVYGIVIVMLYLAIESWLNANSDQHIRGRVFALYMFVNLMALALGQLLLQLSAVGNLELFAIAAAFFSLSLVPLTLTRHPEPSKVDEVDSDLKLLINSAPLGLVACLMSGIAGGAFWSLGPLFTYRVGLDVAQTGMYMSAAIIGGAILQWPLGHWSDRKDRRKLIAVMAFASALIALVTLFIGQLGTTFLILTAFFYGGFYLTIYPLSVAYSNDRNPPEKILLVGSSLLLTYGVGAIIGPLVGGLLMEISGPYSLPLLYVFCWGFLGVYSLVVIAREKPVPADETDTFAPALRTTTIAIEAHAEDIFDQMDEQDSEPKPAQ